jgi:DNA processing protein
MNIAVHIGTDLFPKLAQIPGPPKELWARGSMPPPENKLLAVVGSRALTRYGKEVTNYLIEGLRGYPISIVSGLALGADAAAHTAALNSGLHTIAIPGGGLSDRALYPRSNMVLGKEILAAGGLLISEHPPSYKAAPYDFPSRNRIMVGISDAVLMIEAGPKSGTLITARMACDYNRDLMCVPHRIGDVHSEGAHYYLRQGAALVSSTADILEVLRIPEVACITDKIAETLTESEQNVYRLLEEPVDTDELLRKAEATHLLLPSQTLALLAGLEFKDVLTSQFGVWRRKADS